MAATSSLLHATPITRERHFYAALPWRRSSSRYPQLLLIRPQPDGYWQLPHGRPVGDTAPELIAAHEAFHQAGVLCHPDPQLFGTYSCMGDDHAGGRSFTVMAFALEVRGTLMDWPESTRMKRHWFSPADASWMVPERELARLLARLHGNSHELG